MKPAMPQETPRIVLDLQYCKLLPQLKKDHHQLDFHESSELICLSFRVVTL